MLGPVEAMRGERPLASVDGVSGSCSRCCCCGLGRLVSADTLIDELWRDGRRLGRPCAARLRLPPRSALADETLAAHAAGYALDASPERIDAARFEGLLRDGRTRWPGRRRSRRRPPRSGAGAVARAGVVRRQRRRSSRSRHNGSTSSAGLPGGGIEAELALGHHGELVPELERLVEEQPLRERLWRQLVIALYRSERQAEALDAYRRARDAPARSSASSPARSCARSSAPCSVTRSAASRRANPGTNLPGATSFVGREDELDDLGRLLREQRLITLTGMGGAGKTRLALEVRRAPERRVAGRRLARRTFCPSRIRVAAAGRTLGVTDRPDVTALEGLVEHLRRRGADRARQLRAPRDACAEVHESCALPDVRVLATSRTRSERPGEVDYALEPLPVPADDASVEEADGVASVRLFLDRARGHVAIWTPTCSELETVGRICRELDGLPLAIELAAAHAKVLSLDEIAPASTTASASSARGAGSPTRATDAPRDDRLELRPPARWRPAAARPPVRLRRKLHPRRGCRHLPRRRRGDGAGAPRPARRIVARRLGRSGGESRFRLLETVREYAAERLAADLGRRVEPPPLARRVLPRGRPARAALSRRGRGPSQGRKLQRSRDSMRSRQPARGRPRCGCRSSRSGTPAVRCALALLAHPRLPPTRPRLARAALALPSRSPPTVRADASPEPRCSRGSAARFTARECSPTRASRRTAPRARPLRSRSLNVLVTLAGRGRRLRARAEARRRVDRRVGSGEQRAMEAVALFILAEAALTVGCTPTPSEAGDGAVELARPLGGPEILANVLAHSAWLRLRSRLADARARLTEGARARPRDRVRAPGCHGLRRPCPGRRGGSDDAAPLARSARPRRSGAWAGGRSSPRRQQPERCGARARSRSSSRTSSTAAALARWTDPWRGPRRDSKPARVTDL